MTRRFLRPPAPPKPRGRWRWLLLALPLAGLWYSALPGLSYYRAVTPGNARAAQSSGLRLGDYSVDIEKRPIDGLTQNVSGLTHSSETGTLFAVINRPAEAAEISPEGKLLRRIPIRGGSDPEGITHVGGDVFVIADEGDQSLYRVRIGPRTREIVVEPEQKLKLGYRAFPNMGFEGVSWDAVSRRLFVVQEMLPLRVLAVSGLSPAGGTSGLEVEEWTSPDLSGLVMLDLSSVSLHEPSGNLLLLSHMSAMLVEYLPDGRAIGMLPLRAGMSGLSATVARAEGVALGPRGEIYVVAEPNHFYRFTAAPAATMRQDGGTSGRG